MKPLKAVGFWKSDIDGSGENFPLPVQSKNSIENKGKLISYLQNGIIVSEWLGFSFCRFIDGPSEERMGNSDLSDGVWVWPEGLFIYVELYNILLPEVFIRHIKSCNYNIPKNIAPEHIDNTDYDYSLWTAWGKITQPNESELYIYQTKPPSFH